MLRKDWICSWDCGLCDNFGMDCALKGANCLLLEDIAGEEKEGCEYEH